MPLVTRQSRHIFMSRRGTNVFTCAINFDVVIDYQAIFAEPRVLTESERNALKQLRRMAISVPPVLVEEKSDKPSSWF